MEFLFLVLMHRARARDPELTGPGLNGFSGKIKRGENNGAALFQPH